ncbi:MAG TPA: Fe-S cluster assembly protein SufD [Hyphomonadaceae bacterium]|nr:Fe-S cluster assembly protein SufD [Hyphomonadaceae bacterium]
MFSHLLPTRRAEGWRWSDIQSALNDINQRVRVPREEEWSESAEAAVAHSARAGNVIAALAAGTADGWYSSWGPPFSNTSNPMFDQLGEVGSVGGRELEANEELVVVQHLKPEGGLAAHCYDFVVGPGARLTRVLLQSGDGVALVSGRVIVREFGQLRQFVLAEGAKLARIETHVEIEGEGAEVELHGVYFCDAGRHADLTSVVTHKAANGKTKQLIKGVARKGGRGVFQGKIVVERGARKTDARQYHHGMLLEEGAEIFAKPELMIHADDVACAHGNTAGGLDESALFYLRSRGLAEAEARALLIEAFLLEAVPEWLPAAVRDEVEARIGAWLRS